MPVIPFSEELGKVGMGEAPKQSCAMGLKVGRVIVLTVIFPVSSTFPQPPKRGIW